MSAERCLLSAERCLLSKPPLGGCFPPSQGSHGTSAEPEARPRKRRGQLDNLPDLTAPMRGFGRDPECLADDPEAEYHGAYTVRTCKLRPGYFCDVWIRDSVLKTEYETTVMVLGFSHDLNSEQPSPNTSSK